MAYDCRFPNSENCAYIESLEMLEPTNPCALQAFSLSVAPHFDDLYISFYRWCFRKNQV